MDEGKLIPPLTVLRLEYSVRWMQRFALSDTSRPTWASVPMFSFLLQLKYFSDILWTSDSVQWPWHFCIIGQLAPNSAECSDVFPFCYDSNISLIYCRRPTLHNGRSVFALSDNLHPIWPSVPMFSFHNISPFLFPDLFS